MGAELLLMMRPLQQNVGKAEWELVLMLCIASRMGKAQRETLVVPARMGNTRYMT